MPLQNEVNRKTEDNEDKGCVITLCCLCALKEYILNFPLKHRSVDVESFKSPIDLNKLIDEAFIDL